MRYLNGLPAALLALGLAFTGLRAQPTMTVGDAGNPPPPRLPSGAIIRRPEVTTPAPVALSVTTTNRAQSRAFYNAVFSASEGVPIDWTGSLSGTPGSVANGSAGTTADAYKAAVQLRINWVRAMAGLPAAVGFDSVESGEDQDAALMMAANNTLSHTPPNTWLLYTSDGATAASNSNLALGNVGPDAIINGYIMDPGSNNTALGHRRWILYPQTQTMATGDIPATNGFNSANATWVFDSNYGGLRPAVRDNFVAWPPPGYVPYQVVFPRWSFSYPNADFSSATVTMTSNGNAVPVVLEPLDNPAYGENTIGWDYNGLDPDTVETSATNPGADLTYAVSVNGVKINGSPQNFSYTVTVFDPAAAGTGEVPTTINGSASPAIGQNNVYAVVGIPAFATGFIYRTLSLSAFSTVFGAEGGLQGVVASTSSGYNPVDTTTPAPGNASYHLEMPDFTTQTLTLPGEYVVPQSTASLSFASQLGYAGTGQTAHVQISTNDGLTWTDVYAQTGTDGPGESSFTTHVVPLAAYAGLVIMVRFTYTYTDNLEAFPQLGTGFGWNIDTITLSGVDAATINADSSPQTGSSFTFSPASSASVALQAESVLFGLYPVSWGPIFIANPATGTIPTITTQPTPVTISAGGTVTLTAAASGSPAPTYQWQLNGVNLANATGATLVIPNVGTDQSGAYTVVATNAAGSVTSNSAAVTVNVNAHLINLSSRSYVGTGAQVLVAGFVVAGSGTKQVLIRGDGPVLTTFNVSGALAHPLLSLFDSTSTVIATNAGWSSASVLGTSKVAATIGPATANVFNQVYAFTLPTGSADSAMLAGLPSAAYTAEISGVGNTTGVALAELYDADTGTPTAHLINLSARAFVNTGSGVLVAGFVISGSSSETVLIRGVGPALGLAPFNLPGALAAPQLTLYDNTAAIIASNTGWSTAPTIGSSTVAAGVQAATAPLMASLYAFSLASGSADCAMVVTLPPGAYTAQVSGAGSTTGVGLVEVYDVP